ncbi:MAG: hypothetical protein WAM09_05380 [Anaerolineales bacterium]|jgi:hypothetical protein
MNQLGYIPMMDYEQQHEELIKEAAQSRLVYEALKSVTPKMHSTSRILALIGKELADLGTTLEKRYGIRAETEVAVNKQSNLSGCS